MKILRRIMAVALVLVLVLTMTACGDGQGLTLRISLPEAVNTLDPAMVTTESEKIVVNHLYENLMKFVSDGQGGVKAVPGMAASYKAENNLDGTQTYTFTLRDGITWSDGQAVIAEDFVNAWRRLADPKTESPNAYMLDMVAGYAEARSSGDMTKLQVSAPDTRTLVVVLRHNSLHFPQMLCTSAVTMPVRQDAPEGQVLTNGAYRSIVSHENGILVAHTDEAYYDARRLGPEALEFYCGVEAAVADFRLTYDGTEGEEWNLGSLPYTGTLVINQMATISPELRRAMSLVIDRHEISDLLGSVYVPAQGLIPHGVLNTQGSEYRTALGSFIDSDPATYEARCQEAKALIASQVLPAEGNVSLSYVSDPATDQVAAALQTTWKEQLGLSVTLQALSLEELTKNLGRGDFTMALVMMSCQRNDAADMLQDWTSKAEENYAHISDNAYDLLMRISDASSRAEARDAYLGDAEKMLLETGHVVPICFMTDSWQLRDDLDGVYADGMGRYFFSSVAKKEK